MFFGVIEANLKVNLKATSGGRPVRKDETKRDQDDQLFFFFFCFFWGKRETGNGPKCMGSMAEGIPGPGLSRRGSINFQLGISTATRHDSHRCFLPF